MLLVKRELIVGARAHLGVIVSRIRTIDQEMVTIAREANLIVGITVGEVEMGISTDAMMAVMDRDGNCLL